MLGIDVKHGDDTAHEAAQFGLGSNRQAGVDAGSGLAHTVRGTSGAVNDLIEANSLVRESDREVFVDAGYQGAGKRPDAREDVSWHIAMRPGKRRLLDPAKPIEAPDITLPSFTGRLLSLTCRTFASPRTCQAK